MAYLSQQQNLEGLFDWIPGLIKPAAIAAAPIPLPLKIAAMLGVPALQVTKPTMPPLYKEVTALPPLKTPLTTVAPAPASQPKVANQVQGIFDTISSALHLTRTSAQPLAPTTGTKKPTVAKPQATTATRVSGAPSGQPSTSPPIDVETRTIVNGGTFPMIVPAAASPQMPPWVLPVAGIGAAFLLFSMMKGQGR